MDADAEIQKTHRRGAHLRKYLSTDHRTTAAPIKDPAALDGVKFGRAARDHKARRSMDFITELQRHINRK
jgi:hypothetical protein